MVSHPDLIHSTNSTCHDELHPWLIIAISSAWNPQATIVSRHSHAWKSSNWRNILIHIILILSIRQILQQKKKILLLADGGVQQIKSVIRAIMRLEKDNLDVINEDSSPTKVLKFISSQVANLQHMDERPEHLTKIIKRMKSMVRLQIFHPLSAQFYFSTNAQ